MSGIAPSATEGAPPDPVRIAAVVAISERARRLMADGDEGGSERCVLAGNPVLELYSEGGYAAVDAWIDEQRAWSRHQVTQMLHELAGALRNGTADLDDETDHDSEDSAVN